MLSWFRRKARIADGTEPGLPVVVPRSVDGVLDRAHAERPGWKVARGRLESDPWSVLRVGLLRDLAAGTWTEIAGQIGLTANATKAVYAFHRRLIGENEDYATTASAMAIAALRRCHAVETADACLAPY